jgi:hypothetical protein
MGGYCSPPAIAFVTVGVTTSLVRASPTFHKGTISAILPAMQLTNFA